MVSVSSSCLVMYLPCNLPSASPLVESSGTDLGARPAATSSSQLHFVRPALRFKPCASPLARLGLTDLEKMGAAGVTTAAGIAPKGLGSEKNAN